MTRNSAFIRVSPGGYQGWLMREYAETTVRASLETLLGSGFRSQAAISAYPDRQVYRLELRSSDINHACDVKEVYVKRYLLTTSKRILQTIFRVNKSQKSWRIGKIFLEKGVLTPRCVAYFTRWTSFFSGEHILVTEGIPHGVSLEEYVRTRIQRSSDHFHKRRLLKSLAEFLAGLHQQGIYHGDFTANNIFVSPQESGRLDMYLIDLDSVRSTSWISARRCLKNLDELGRSFFDLRVITTSDRIRFLNYYVKACPRNLTLHQLFTQVWQRTQFRLHKHNQQFF